jgi:hypothetical protein
MSNKTQTVMALVIMAMRFPRTLERVRISTETVSVITPTAMTMAMDSPMTRK